MSLGLGEVIEFHLSVSPPPCRHLVDDQDATAAWAWMLSLLRDVVITARRRGSPGRRGRGPAQGGRGAV